MNNIISNLSLIHCPKPLGKLAPLTLVPEFQVGMSAGIKGLDMFSTIIDENTWEHLSNSPDVFNLTTCQRTIFLTVGDFPCHYIKGSTKVYKGAQAYHFMLELLCGLKSQVLAEYEIVAQFREAYAHFTSKIARSTSILKVLEKLLKDSKEVRTNYLMKIGGLSYAGLARKLILSKNISNNRILILGSGKLAENIAGLMFRKFNITLSARNHARMSELKSKFKIETRSIVDANDFLNYPIIINTIGNSNLNIFKNSGQLLHDWTQFHKSENRILIDMASPSVFNNDFKIEDQVYRLENLLKLAGEESLKNQKKVEIAMSAISHLVTKRTNHELPKQLHSLQ